VSVKGRELALQDLNAREHGLPLSNPTRKPPAATSPSCGREVFFEWFTKRHPVFATSTTPTYSNVAFQILSYALEAITGKTFPAMLKTNIIKALDLNDTTFTRPLNDSNCIIPGDTSTTMWDFDLGELSPYVNHRQRKTS
jgi:CubicO group peptidase (beta-lactamase class C family)